MIGQLMQKPDVTKLPVVLTLPKMDEVSLQQVEYVEDSDGALGLDIYYPPGCKLIETKLAETKLAVVILVTGHADPTIEAAVGCKLKDSEAYISWAKLIAVSGVVAITYANRNPAQDIASLIDYLKSNADLLNIDLNRVGIWSCSANVPNALALAISGQINIRCAAFLYGFMFDRGGKTFVADAASQSGFAAPNANSTIDDMPRDMALRIIRAGADQIPGINQTIDDFCSDALSRNLPVTLVNHSSGRHSFDIFDDGDLSRVIIRDLLSFLAFHLR